MSHYQGAVFDLDGTLVVLDIDIEAVRARVAQLFSAAGIVRPFSPILTAIDAAATELGVDTGPALRSQALEMITRAEVAAAGRARPRRGAAELVRAAARVGEVSVVTNNSRWAAELALQRLVPEIAPVIVGREDVARPKPDPEGILLATRQWAGQGAIVVVGDSPVDVRAARAAGAALGRAIEVAVVAGGRAEAAELAGLVPDRMVDEPASLIEWFEAHQR